MRRPEQILQQQVVRFLDMAYPAVLAFHCPNGGARSAVEGAILKSMGVRPGVPDLCLLLPCGRTAWIELKAGKGKLTAAQEAFRDKAQALDHFWAEARSPNEVADILERWLQPFGILAKARLAA